MLKLLYLSEEQEVFENSQIIEDDVVLRTEANGVPDLQGGEKRIDL